MEAQLEPSSNLSLSGIDRPHRISVWASSLLDLSFDNPLLDLQRRGSPLRFATSTHEAAAVYDELRGSGRLPLSANGGLAGHAAVGQEGTATSLELRVRALVRSARERRSRTGDHHLFLTVGVVGWRADLGTDRGSMGYAPLLLIPVRIVGRPASTYSVEVVDGGVLQPNVCLAERFHKDFRIDPALFTSDACPLESTEIYFERVIRGLCAGGVEAEVAGTVHLAVLGSSNHRLWTDVSAHWPQFITNSVIRHLVEAPGQTFENNKSQGSLPNEVLCPMDCDSTQLDAVRWAVAGR